MSQRFTRKRMFELMDRFGERGFQFAEVAEDVWIAEYKATGHQSREGTAKDVLFWAEGFDDARGA